MSLRCLHILLKHLLFIFWLHLLVRISMHFKRSSLTQTHEALNDASRRYISTSMTEPACDKCNWE